MDELVSLKGALLNTNPSALTFFQTPLSSHGNSRFACELQTFALAARSWVSSIEVIRRWGGGHSVIYCEAGLTGTTQLKFNRL